MTLPAINNFIFPNLLTIIQLLEITLKIQILFATSLRSTNGDIAFFSATRNNMSALNLLYWQGVEFGF